MFLKGLHLFYPSVYQREPAPWACESHEIRQLQCQLSDSLNLKSLRNYCLMIPCNNLKIIGRNVMAKRSDYFYLYFFIRTFCPLVSTALKYTSLSDVGPFKLD